jgi:hypothetical protein
MDPDPQSTPPDDSTGPTPSGAGPAWPPLPEPVPPAPRWINGRAWSGEVAVVGVRTSVRIPSD